jgi:hypothetical protein
VLGGQVSVLVQVDAEQVLALLVPRTQRGS